MMNERMLNVLFLCTGNSARSILAEAILGREERAIRFLFGAVCRREGFILLPPNCWPEKADDISGFRSKNWDEFAVDGGPKMDLIFTVCDNAANEVCPIWPGQPVTAHWGVPDPRLSKDRMT